ncbi:uncharacterized protein LOC131690011 [Topomyia yanbarensis]|uniref:uncharacterized protein LOC131690011 n=1 Tax=Topomyia yanbarensis TaxID=2498891 RepID=UPI00273B6AE1|nr:uncharacterized protein LOC131690011 [Topomyia yanbarensis]
MWKAIPLVVFLVLPALLEAKPDLALPVSMLGVSTGSLDTSGNIVSNVDRIQYILNQFQSIVQSLYSIQTPELSSAADNFRFVMDSLVVVGSPIFQALSSASKVSSGNISRIVRGIEDDIDYAVALHEVHVQLVNETRQILGENSTNYFNEALNSLVDNVESFVAPLYTIKTAVEGIQSQKSLSRDEIKARLPNEAIKELNAALREYIRIGDAAVPQIRSVVSRVQTVDNFLIRLSAVVSQQRQYLNSSLARISPYLESNVISRFRSSLSSLSSQVTQRSGRLSVTLSNLFLMESEVLRVAANQTIPAIQAFAMNISNDANAVLQQIAQLTVNQSLPYIVLNETERLLNEASRGLSLAMTQRIPRADTCYSQHNYDFDRIPRMVYSQSYSCVWDTASDLSAVAINLNYIIQLALIDLNSGLQAVERCAGLVSRSSPALTKYQASVCLDNARRFISNRRVYAQQMANYQVLLGNEISYSAQRYNFCMMNTLSQAQAQISYLDAAVNQCLNITQVVTPMKWWGKLSIGFGK